MYVSSVLVRCKKESSKVRWGGVGRRRVPLPPTHHRAPKSENLAQLKLMGQNAFCQMLSGEGGWVAAGRVLGGHVFS